MGHARGLLRQVRTAYVTQKEGVAREYGYLLAGFVAKYVAGRFHGVARGVQHLNGHISYMKYFTVGGNVGLKFGIGVGSVHDGGICGF